MPTSLTSKITIGHDPRTIGQQVHRIGGDITPNHVSAICARADTGYMQMLCDLGDDSRQRDAHLGSILHRRENAVGGVPWQVIPPSEGRKALRIAAFVEHAFKQLGEDPGPDGEDLLDTRKLVCSLNGAIFPGYAAAEMLWKKAGRYLMPTGAIAIPARRFVYSVNGAELRWWDESGPMTAYPGLDLRKDFPAGRFIMHRPRISGGVGPREGFMRPLVWSSLFRTWSLGDWLRESELASKPYRWGEYEQGAQDEDIAALEKALRTLTANGWASLPKSTNLKIEYPKGARGGENIHQSLCMFLASEESKLVLGSTLTSEQGRTGAMALGNVHAGVTRELLELDARQIEESLRRCFIVPLVRRNFGRNAPIPEFRFLTEEGTDLRALAEALDKLLGRGLRIPARWVRATFGIPEPEEGDELIGMGAAAPVGEAPKKAPEASEDTVVTEIEEPEAEEPEEEASEDDEGPDDVDVDERTLYRMRSAYRAHAVLCAAGVRRPSSFSNVALAGQRLIS